MNSLLVDAEGKIRSFGDFKKEVFKTHKKYNQNYLQAEYQTAKRSAQAARQWKGYEANADLFPNLKYVTIGDDRVREDHQYLHGIIKPINDSFWETHYPPNGFRCRCSVQPTTDLATEGTPKIKIEESFTHNVGKTNELFMEKKHPYFTIPKSDKKEVDKKVNGLLAIHSAKEVVKFAREHIVGRTFKTVDNISLQVSVTNVKTITQKPHIDRVGRNNLLYNLKDTLKNATFVKKVAEEKGRSQYVEWYYYLIEQNDVKYYLNVVKTSDGRVKLHAITDKIIKKGS